ncbi:MAG: BrnT family toxin [Methylobacterium sp.]|uniref:BrnT family toxin n=1 Tax=Methylobacterium sp. TaxID=409 RepID=UPI00258B890B|nr:BrnT family toxin [Methylobacterium sp.]MBY0296634.1 BrnT family toxin [Methylobacterium sp.]
MAITFDPAKRNWTLEQRGIDFLSAMEVFAGPRYTFEDQRFDYGEKRYVTIGLRNGRMLVVVWTERGADQHVLSMRKANAREQARYAPLLR